MTISTVTTAPHEFVANYLFNSDGLAPFFAADRRVKDGDGKQVGEFETDNERWVVRLYYQSSGLVHPGDVTPTGTEFRIDELREYRLKVARHPDQDPVGEQSFNAHLAPRWPGMQYESDDGSRGEVSQPDDFGEGINVRLSGSNIEFMRYLRLLQEAAEAVGIDRRYFLTPHEYSNVQDAERYVRLRRDRSGPIHARTGPITRMAHLLESDRQGYRKLVQNDSDEQGRTLPGYYHTVTLDQKRVQAAFPSHVLPKEIKHYYAREAHGKPKSDPLAHPKLGASYQVSRWDGKLGVSPDDLADLAAELECAVLSVLSEAGVQIHVGPDDPFVDDAYFAADEQEHDESPIVSLDLTEIESHQENVVIKHLSDGFSPVEWESIETLVADGGDLSPTEIADSIGRHVDSVRRALRRLPDVVEADYGSVALRSDHVANLLTEAVEEARESTRRAVEAAAKVKQADERGVDDDTSALIAFCARHGIDVNDTREAKVELRMSNTSRLEWSLQEAYDLWCAAGKDPQRFREAKVDLGDKVSTAWRWL
jgi:hypothetical protein